MKDPVDMKSIEDMLWTAYHENHTITSKIDLLTIILPQAKEFHGVWVYGSDEPLICCLFYHSTCKFAVKIEEVCNHMGVVCQYFWPMSAISPSMKYLMKAASEIRSKVICPPLQCQTFCYKVLMIELLYQVVRHQSGQLPSVSQPIESSEPKSSQGMGTMRNTVRVDGWDT